MTLVGCNSSFHKISLYLVMSHSNVKSIFSWDDFTGKTLCVKIETDFAT